MKKQFLHHIIFAFISCLVVITNVEAAGIPVDGWKVEYWRNHPIGTPSNDYDQAIIVIHGTSRNADDYYNYIVTAAETENILDHTLIVAPKFQIQEDTPRNDELYWSNSGWKKGFKSTNGNRTPSFEVIDAILENINSNFQNITFVTIVGHSAGGQFVQRYAALNQKEQTLRQGLEVRYIVANPSSYMYLTNDRPESIANCHNYDNYKYGMENLPDDLHYTDLNRASIQNQLISRSIYILLGTQDNNPNSNNLDISCMANAQGFNRYERGTLYYQHVKDFNLNANHVKIDIEGVGHNAKNMFNSIEGREAILYANTNDISPREMTDIAFNYLEDNYNQWFSPHKATIENTNNGTTVYYRYYSSSNSYLYIWSDSHLWYNIGGTGWYKSSTLQEWYDYVR